MVAIFLEEYLRSPNNDDITRLLAHSQNRGFSGMLGSIDCMHWKWKNYALEMEKLSNCMERDVLWSYS